MYQTIVKRIKVPKKHEPFNGKVLEAQKSVMASVANQVTEK